jgi:hypothetical protein
MTEDEKRETIRMHLSLIMQHPLPSYAIALLSGAARWTQGAAAYAATVISRDMRGWQMDARVSVTPCSVTSARLPAAISR